VGEEEETVPSRVGDGTRSVAIRARMRREAGATGEAEQSVGFGFTRGGRRRMLACGFCGGGGVAAVRRRVVTDCQLVETKQRETCLGLRVATRYCAIWAFSFRMSLLGLEK
jgi:hypothetical protein